MLSCLHFDDSFVWKLNIASIKTELHPNLKGNMQIACYAISIADSIQLKYNHSN